MEFDYGSAMRALARELGSDNFFNPDALMRVALITLEHWTQL
jgi:hypothetical protein